MMNKPIFCALAFGSVNITTENKYLPCCNVVHGEYKSNYTDLDSSGTPEARFNNSWLVDVRQSLNQGIWHDSCSLCEHSEKQGNQSMRNIWNIALSEYDIPIDTLVNPANVRYISVAFSNKCNSKCMTCSPDSSSLWHEEFNVISQDKFVYQTIPSADRIHSTPTELLNTFSNAEHISLLGGEPTVANEHDSLIHELVSSGRSKNISLTYVTNLTGITDELLDTWKRFKHVTVMASIDGVGLCNEYIRYPFKWDKIERNLTRLFELSKTGQISVGLSCTAGMFNCIDIADLLLYWYSKNKEYGIDFGVYTNIVTNPEYVVTSIMSDKHRAVGIERLKTVKKLFDADINLNSSYSSVVSVLIDHLSLPRATPDLINSAKHFILGSDEFRNRSIKDYIPKVWEDLFE